MFCEHDNPTLFKPIFDALLSKDYFFVLADLEAFDQAIKQASQVYKKKDAWFKKAIYNVARIGYFSSDRSVMEYAKNIWHVKPIEDKKADAEYELAQSA